MNRDNTNGEGFQIKENDSKEENRKFWIATLILLVILITAQLIFLLRLLI